MISLKVIEDFLVDKKLAVAGVSRHPEKFGNKVFSMLKEKGYELMPVNPNADSINGVKSYHAISLLPAGTLNLLIVTPKSLTTQIVKEAISKGIKKIWIQQKSDTPEAIEMSISAGITLITGQCIFMFADPKGKHRFHRSILRFFGKLPK